MSSKMGRNTLAIIGAGLVGGAVLREILLGWLRTCSASPATLPKSIVDSVQDLNLGKIYVTALRKSDLDDQLQKLRDVLEQREGVIVDEVSSRLTFSVRSGVQNIRVEAVPLDIIPDGLATTTLNDEVFRTKSAFYSYIKAIREKQSGDTRKAIGGHNTNLYYAPKAIGGHNTNLYYAPVMARLARVVVAGIPHHIT